MECQVEVVDAEERKKQKENLENQKRDEERREKPEEKENLEERDDELYFSSTRAPKGSSFTCTKSMGK